ESLLPLRETMKSLDALVRGGLARFIGFANFPVWRVADVVARADFQVAALQSDYSLLTRARFEPEAMPFCQEQQVGFLARSPLAGGFLVRGKEQENRFNTARHDWLEQRFASPSVDTALVAVDEVADRYEVSSAQVALSWV